MSLLLVTGASSDIGSRVIECTADRFDTIVAHYNSGFARIEQLKASIGAKLITKKADFTSELDTRSFAEQMKAEGLVPTHILHLPAGVYMLDKFSKISWENYQRDWEISFRSIVLILQVLLPQMAVNKFGKIVFMLSSCTLNEPPKFLSNYVAVKYALLGLMKELAHEYANKGIAINGVSPDMTDTKYLNTLSHLVIEQNAAGFPNGRILSMNDIVPTIMYLLSEGSNSLTGQNIGVTAGKY